MPKQPHLVSSSDRLSPHDSRPLSRLSPYIYLSSSIFLISSEPVRLDTPLDVVRCRLTPPSSRCLASLVTIVTPSTPPPPDRSSRQRDPSSVVGKLGELARLDSQPMTSSDAAPFLTLWSFEEIDIRQVGECCFHSIDRLSMRLNIYIRLEYSLLIV